MHLGVSSHHPTEDLRSQGAFRDNSEIGELRCDHCLAPCDHAEENIGYDNVTIVIVTLLHGRTKEEELRYSWIHRVETSYGYKTPSETRRICHMDEI